jgi:hypothetical protein
LPPHQFSRAGGSIQAAIADATIAQAAPCALQHRGATRLQRALLVVAKPAVNSYNDSGLQEQFAAAPSPTGRHLP